MKGFIKEFKEFINRGNVIDMAVGVIIGAAFKDIVTSLVENIINPIIGLFGGKNFDQYELVLFGEATLKYGAFITTVINFLIMALVIFCMIKIVSAVTKKFEKPVVEEPKAPTTKKCPYCMSEIAIEATRCPHCTSVLEEE